MKEIFIFSFFVYLSGCRLISSENKINEQKIVEEVRRSHIVGNVPATKEDFDKIMDRDLTDFFKKRYPKFSSVSYVLLRNAPTQSGISYPRFYAWIEIKENEKTIEAGAVNVAFIERKSIDVREFITAKEVNEDRDMPERVFPAALCDSIREKAKSQIY